MMPWLYLHFPSLQLDGLSQQNQLMQNDKPLIIVDAKQNAIVQLNQAAKNEGLKLGMGLATAISLSADLVIVDYNSQVERTRIQELAQWLYQVVADIALFEPNGLALEVTHMLSLYDSIDSYWLPIETILTQQKVNFHRALAPTPIAARLLAKVGHQPINLDSKAINDRLGQLSTNGLELPPIQIEKLHRVGIHNLSQLWQISSKELGRRFGLEVLNYLAKIKGQLKHPLHFYEPPEFFTKYLELFHEINQSQVLLFPLKRMVHDMACFLAGRELVVTTVTVTLHYRKEEEASQLVIEVGSAQGEYKADNWMTLVSLKIERTRLEAAVVGITITTGELLEKNCTVDDLFSTGKGSMTTNQLISVLQAKVGKKHIVGLQLCPDHRPEHAFHYVSPQLSGTSPQKNVQSTDLPELRPLILLDIPQPLLQHYCILQGPERVRSAWWSQQCVYRDYFIARSEQGAVCWLFNEPQGNWFLHGYFC